MQKFLIILGCGTLILLTIGGFIFFKFAIEPVDEALYANTSSLAHRAPQAIDAVKPVQSPAQTPKANTDGPTERLGLNKRPIQKSPEDKKEYPKYIEDIKKQVYERQIESVNQIPLLDEIVQTREADVQQFWGDGWSSVDDWKKEENGFILEKKEDGTLVFNPGPATARQYTFFQTPQTYQYDAEHKEFVNEVDYYGKTIYNVVKFINDDVMAMMTISGTKVDLNLYQKNAGQIIAPQANKHLPGELGAPRLTH
jgi:hypothetical protein